MINYKDYNCIEKTEWHCPKGGGAPILTMPNVPRALHTQCPRTILGSSTWNAMRKSCYAEAGYVCEVCGYKPDRDNREWCHAHELFNINYKHQTSEYERAICLCSRCHLLCLHTGRALTLYKQGSPLYTKEKLLTGAEHCFKIVSRWNEEHPEEEPLRVYQTWLDYLDHEELKDDMLALIDKYDMKFYSVANKWENKTNWKKWKIRIGNRWYKTKFETKEAWAEAMTERNCENIKGEDHGYKGAFTGDIYDEIDKILKG